MKFFLWRIKLLIFQNVAPRIIWDGCKLCIDVGVINWPHPAVIGSEKLHGPQQKPGPAWRYGLVGVWAAVE